MSLIYARVTRVPHRDFASGRNPCGGIRDNLCTSQNSLDHKKGLYSEVLYNRPVSNEIGSSLSMDSGNPLGTQSLESLDDRSHATNNVTSDEACFTSTVRCVHSLRTD